MDVHITHDRWPGNHRYQIWVDGKVEYTFFAKPPLTWSQESDTVTTYREALEYWSD